MKIQPVAALLLWALQSPAIAHELESNRATLVLRDRQHLALTIYVDYARVLHQVLAPQQPLSDFLVTCAAMKPKEFQSQLLEVQRKLQSGVAVTFANGKAALLTQWVWPQAKSVQAALQQRAMQAVVAPDDHAHGVPLEIRAQASFPSSPSSPSSSVPSNPPVTSDFATITLQLPAPFQPVLVVSYQPKQVWMKTGTLSTTIKF